MKEAKCEICKKPLPFQEFYPKGRKDIELIFYKGGIKGIMFCSEKCFKEYVQRWLKNRSRK